MLPAAVPRAVLHVKGSRITIVATAVEISATASHARKVFEERNLLVGERADLLAVCGDDAQ